MAQVFPAGSRLGSYIIESRVSKAGLLSVYTARHADTDRPCRLTVLHVDPDEDAWQSFERECAQLKALSHPGIVEIYEARISDGGVPYLVTELPAGEDLATRLRRGAFTTREAQVLAQQVAAALHAAHRIDIVHRDIHPENILLLTPPSDSPAPPFERVKVLGFGLQRLLESTTAGHTLVGHPEFMAPEQVLGFSIEVGPRADQYALALLLYQALTTSRPFRSESVGGTLVQVVRTQPEPLRALRPDLPMYVEDAVKTALSKEQNARFVDLPAFVSALQGHEALPEELIALTEPWLRSDAAAEAARQRALGASSAPPSFQSVALGLADGGGGGVPEIVEDSATVPNSMEDVMKLAMPRPVAVAAPAVSTNEEGSDTDPAARPVAGISGSGLPGVRSGEQRIPGGRGDMQSGETRLPANVPVEKPAVPSIIVHGDTPHSSDRSGSGGSKLATGKPSAALADPPPAPSMLASIGERALWLIFGLILGFLVRHFIGN